MRLGRSNGSPMFIKASRISSTKTQGRENTLFVNWIEPSSHRSCRSPDVTGQLAQTLRHTGQGRSRRRFLEILDAATQQLVRDRAFTEYGQEWVAFVVAQ